ncbi:S8 family serine peptidase [Persicobacter diffluens]|uniref:Fibronectin type-III domain-containing protein n=1 Tax=Persicobacter diffluens TaxID=981 RepID=A0AAN4W2Y5_9BACT|nr:hypothetical protein PEDI_35720 [Persicobacter diffluens]
MPKLLRMLLVLVLLVNSSVYAQKSKYVDGRLQGVVHLKFKEGSAPGNSTFSTARGGQLEIGAAEFDGLSQQFGAYQLEPIFKMTRKNAEKLKKHGLDRWFKLRMEESSDLSMAIKQFEGLEMVELAEASLEVVREQGTFRKANPQQVSKKRRKQMPMNDPLLADQWHYHNDGTVSETAVAGADINLFPAWERITGSKEVIVSIHDEGMDVNHEDLKAAMWVNPGEAEDGEDSDDNGYVDDIHGFNFVQYTGDIDAQDHGTHVGGTVGAVNNNGIGVSGVAGGSDASGGVRLMSLQILGMGTSDARIAESFVYAADNGAVISQNSWGYSQSDFYEQVVLDAIDYFIAEAGDYEGSPMKGGVVIVAAGNLDTEEDKWYPAAYEPVIAVSALAPNFEKASYSNYGSWLDIAAPGGDGEMGGIEEVLSTLPNNEYGYFGGTSMACPHVSGIAALMLSMPENKGITAAELNTLLFSSLQDVDAFNLEYKGLLGKGYIDAELATRVNHGNLPAKIDNFNLRGAGFDFIAMEWTVRHDGDGSTAPVAFEVHYKVTGGEEKVFEIENEYATGTPLKVDLSELEASTEYEVSIQAVNRFGVKSDRSAVQKMRTSAQGASFEITRSHENNSGTQQFTINPNDLPDVYVELKNTSPEGSNELLRWSIGTDILDSDDGALDPDDIEGLNPTPAPYEVEKKAIADAEIIMESTASERSDYQDEDLDYGDDKWERKISYRDQNSSRWTWIGDGGKRATHSVAQAFTVSESADRDFIFRRANIELVVNKMHGDIEFEIYVGEQLRTAKKVYENSYSVSGEEEVRDIHRISAAGPRAGLRIRPGETFWTIFHIPAGKDNAIPLVIDEGVNEAVATRSLMSLDYGESWKPVAEVMTEAGMADWERAILAVEAEEMTRSDYDSRDKKIINLVPSKGELMPQESIRVPYEFDLEEVRDFTATTTNQNFYINNSEEDFLTKPMFVGLTGQPVDLSFPKLAGSGGELVVGEQSIIHFEMINEGHGQLNMAQVATGGGAFDLSDPVNFGVRTRKSSIGPRLRTFFEFYYHPQTSGFHRTKVSFSDKDTGEKYDFELTGSARESGEMEVINPNGEELTYIFDNVDMGDEPLKGSFIIKNISNSDAASLEYMIPGYSEQSIPGHDLVNSYGYGIETNVEDFVPEADGTRNTPEWKDIRAEGTEITDHIRTQRQKDFAVNIGFAFDFFGEEHDSVYVSRYGVLGFDSFTYNATPQFKGHTMNMGGYISAMHDRLTFSSGGTVHYFQDKGVLTVQYTDVALDHPIYYDRLWSYQFKLYDNGNIEIIYEKLPDVKDEAFDRLYVAVESRNQQDGVLFQKYYLNEGHERPDVRPGGYVKLISPGRKLITAFTKGKTAGTIEPGAQEELEFEIDPEKWYEGAFNQVLQVLSNSHTTPVANLDISLNIVSGGTSDVVVTDEVLNFGSVFQGAEQTLLIPVQNSGTTVLHIDEVTIAEELFDFEPIEGEDRKLMPRQTMFIRVHINTEDLASSTEGTFSLSFQELEETFEVQLVGAVIPAPEFAWDYVDPVLTVDAGGAVVNHHFTVSNDGASDMQVAFTTGNWIDVNKVETRSGADEEKQYDYVMQTTKTLGSSVAYTWQDLSIDPDAKELDVHYMMSKPFETVELPFAFSFYGEEYTQMQVTDLGFVTFDMEAKGDWHPTHYTVFPDSTAPVMNMIAPLWSPVAADRQIYDDAGTYVKVSEDQVVIQWHLFRDAFGVGEAGSWQLILFSDGSFQYQYNMPPVDKGDDEQGEYIMDMFASIGFQNATGEQGYQVALNENFIAHELAVYFSLQEIFEVPANGEQEFVMDINPRYLSQRSDDEGNPIPFVVGFNAYSNAPGSEVINDQLTLNVVGEGQLEVDETSGTLGTSFFTELSQGEERVFFVHNTGTGPIQITDAYLNKFGEYPTDWQGNPEFAFGQEDLIGWGGFEPIFPQDAKFPITIQAGASRAFMFKTQMMETLIQDDHREEEDILNIFWKDISKGDNAEEQVAELPTQYRYGYPPAVASVQEEVYETVVRGDQKQIAIAVDNGEGRMPLEYQFSIEYGREYEGFERMELNEDAEPMDLKYIAAPRGMKQKNADGEEEEHDDLYPDEEIESAYEVLSYQDFRHSSRALGFGIGMPFTAATKYTAPEEGFKLSKVMFKARNEMVEISDIKVSVGFGDTPANAHVVYEQDLRRIVELEEDEEDDLGTWMTVQLEEEIHVMPYEDFFVFVTFPSTIGFPVFTSVMYRNEYGRFYYGVMNNFFYDLVGDAGFAFSNFQMMAGADNKAGDVAWLHYNGEDNIGEIPAGEVAGEINFTVDGAKLKEEFATAELTIRTNDPVTTKPWYTDLFITVENPTNTEDELDGVQIFPVPAEDVLNVHFQANASGTVSVEFINAIGQKVHEYSEEIFEGRVELAVPVAQMTTGVYFVKVALDGTPIESQRIIKQ